MCCLVTYNRLPVQHQLLVGRKQALSGSLREPCDDSDWIQVSSWTWTLHREVVNQYQSCTLGLNIWSSSSTLEKYYWQSTHLISYSLHSDVIFSMVESGNIINKQHLILHSVIHFKFRYLVVFLDLSREGAHLCWNLDMSVCYMCQQNFQYLPFWASRREQPDVPVLQRLFVRTLPLR